MSSKLIIEAGSTKTDSVLILDDGTVTHIRKSQGINPITDPNYQAAISGTMEPYRDVPSIKKIYHYGAGCIDDATNTKVAQAIRDQLDHDVEIEVQDDLIAVGRGLCQRSPGIVVILGTGSNTGYYDGQEITDGYRSCGYLLGDEGSGYRLGQELITRYARGLLSAVDQDMIHDKTKVSSAEVVRYIYESDNPRTLIASYASHLSSCTTALKEDICHSTFTLLAKHILRPLSQRYDVPIYLSGSIAHYFKDELEDTLKRNDILVTSITPSPLEGLIRYHTYEH